MGGGTADCVVGGVAACVGGATATVGAAACASEEEPVSGAGAVPAVPVPPVPSVPTPPPLPERTEVDCALAAMVSKARTTDVRQNRLSRCFIFGRVNSFSVVSRAKNESERANHINHMTIGRGLRLFHQPKNRRQAHTINELSKQGTAQPTGLHGFDIAHLHKSTSAIPTATSAPSNLPPSLQHASLKSRGRRSSSPLLGGFHP